MPGRLRHNLIRCRLPEPDRPRVPPATAAVVRPASAAACACRTARESRCRRTTVPARVAARSARAARRAMRRGCAHRARPRRAPVARSFARGRLPSALNVIPNSLSRHVKGFCRICQGRLPTRYGEIAQARAHTRLCCCRRRWQSLALLPRKASLEQTVLMSIIALLCLLFGVAAMLLLVLFFLQRRQLSALEEVSRQVQRTAIGGSLKTRIELQTDQPELAALVTAVNHLLSRASVAIEQAPLISAPIGSLGDRVHEAVLIHGKSIRYANPQFASLVGCRVDELIGRRLEDLVPPEYTELVGDNMRRRLAGEAAADRYEIDLTGMQGQIDVLDLALAVD